MCLPYVATSPVTRRENQYVRKTSTCSTNKHSFFSRPDEVTQSWNSPLVLETRRKHILIGFELRVRSNVKHGHTHRNSEPRRTRWTLKQIWPLALINDRRSNYWQTQPKVSVSFFKICRLKLFNPSLSYHVSQKWDCWSLRMWTCW